MTAITIRPRSSSATWTDRVLLQVAAYLDGMVLARLERRSRRRTAGQAAAQDTAVQRRLDAVARAGIGILPR